MSAAIVKEAIHKLAVVLVHFWLWNTDQSATIYYVYPDHCEELQNKRVKVEIEIVDR